MCLLLNLWRPSRSGAASQTGLLLPFPRQLSASLGLEAPAALSVRRLMCSVAFSGCLALSFPRSSSRCPVEAEPQKPSGQTSPSHRWEKPGQGARSDFVEVSPRMSRGAMAGSQWSPMSWSLSSPLQLSGFVLSFYGAGVNNWGSDEGTGLTKVPQLESKT